MSKCPRCRGQILEEPHDYGTDQVCLQCGFRDLGLPELTGKALLVRLQGYRDHARYPNRLRGLFRGGKRGTCGRCEHGFNSFQHRICKADPVPA